MNRTTRMLRAAALAAPLGALALSAQAADIAGTIKEQQQFSTLAKAIDSAGMAQSLQGEGPFTVFAPTDQAFERLPQGAVDELMKQDNQDQLKSVLQYHVVQGKKIMAEDAIGQQTDVDTLAGDRLSVDGTGQMVLLLPTGLTMTRVGDQMIVERDMTAVTAPTVAVAPGGGEQQQSGQQSQQSQSSQQQQAQSGQQQAQSGQQSGSQHDSGMLREATVIEPDIQADNGVIHAIDAVLIPQSVLSKLENKTGQSGQSGQSGKTSSQ